MYERLRRLVGLGAAAFFFDAVRILQGPRPASFNPGTDGEESPGDRSHRLETASHLIGHCMREVEALVRELLISGIPKEPVSKKAKRRAKKGVCITKNDGQRTQVKAILADFGIPLTDAAAQWWVELATYGSKEGLARRAHRNGQGPPRPVDAGLRKAWESFVSLLEVLLDTFEARYTASVYQRLDRLADIESPTEGDIRELKQLPYTEATHRYFFGKATSPEWLFKLKDAGFFDHPPEPVQEEEGFRLPSWPQADYLARVAPKLPNLVRETIDTVRTSNATVQWQLVQVALVLPISESVELASAIRSWVPSLRRFDLVEPLIQYITAVADGGYGDEALALLAALYAVEGNAT